MKILVTGANGYLGQGIVKELLDNNHEVIATGISTENVDNRAKRINANIFDVKDPFLYFDKPDVLLHLAWRDGFIHYSDSHINDLPKHYEFIKKMIESSIGHVAIMGSMHEVGFFEGCVNESTPCFPQTPYGVSKNSLRQLCDILCKQKNVVFQWLRGYYIVGNSKYGSSIFSKITESVEKGKNTFPFTSGQNQFDFIDYNEFCKQVAAVVEQDKVNGVIEICSGRPEKLADRVEKFIKDNGYKIKLNYGEFPDRPYDSKAIWGNNGKIEKILANKEKSK